MLVLSNDTVIGRSLVVYGEWAEHELACLRPYAPDGSTVVDIGANIGTHTLAFAQWVGAGRVISIEPQPAIFGLLTANCLLNARWNVDLVNAVCSHTPGWVQIALDYAEIENCGAVAFRTQPEPRRWMPWNKATHPQRPVGLNNVPVVRLDDLIGDRQVDFLKLDVEGMELECLQGAQRTLRISRPVIFMEQKNTADLPALYGLLVGCGYHLYWLETHPFNLNNFRNAAENLWWQTEIGILALPDTITAPAGLALVGPQDVRPPCRLDARAGIAVLGC
jgi:FkbM family methyltransferase